MARKVVVFDTFAGEHGATGAWKAPKDSFSSTNMIVNRLGELMVRPGLKNITPSGAAAGIVHAFGSNQVPLNDLFYVQGTAVRTFSAGGDNLKTSATALAETPTAPCDWLMDGSTNLLASPTDKIYRISPQSGATNPAVAALTGSPGVSALTIYGDRIIGGNIDGSLGSRLRFSDAANPNSWPSANFIDVGDGWQITSLATQRQHLVISKQFGVYVLTGVPGVNPVLRQISSTDGPLRPLESRRDKLDRVWYQGIFDRYPSIFDGSRPTKFSNLEYTTQTPNSATALPPGTGVAAVDAGSGGSFFVSDSGDKVALFLNGVWTYHTFGVGISGYVAPGGDTVHICDGGTALVAPKFYTWNPTSDTPGIEGTLGRAGDDSATSLAGSVTFPEWWATNGDEGYISAVVVDFRTWATGSATTNHFDLVVSALRRYQAGSAQASGTYSFNEAAASSSATGTLQRRVFGMGEQGVGNGFQLAFSNCRGMAIQRIEVIMETDSVRL